MGYVRNTLILFLLCTTTLGFHFDLFINRLKITTGTQITDEVGNGVRAGTGGEGLATQCAETREFLPRGFFTDFFLSSGFLR